MFDTSSGGCSEPLALPVTLPPTPPLLEPTPGADILLSPCKGRDVNSDINQVMVYRAGFNDGADGRGPFRDAWAYQRGYAAGTHFRSRISGTSEPWERHFPGWPVAAANTTIGAAGGYLPIAVLRRALAGTK